MKSLFSLISIPEENTKKDTPRTERRWYIKQFLDILNASRKGQKIKNKKGIEVALKPLSGAFVASKMAKRKISSVSALYAFLKECKKSKNFSAHWWWALDAKNAKE